MNETLIDLSNERRNKYIEILSRKLNNDFPGKKLENGDAIYDVEVQGTTFTCCYSDDEIKAMIGYSVDILEELRKINDDGFKTKNSKKNKKNNLPKNNKPNPMGMIMSNKLGQKKYEEMEEVEKEFKGKKIPKVGNNNFTEEEEDY